MRESEDDKWALRTCILIAIGLLTGILLTVLVQKWTAGHANSANSANSVKTALAEVVTPTPESSIAMGSPDRRGGSLGFGKPSPMPAVVGSSAQALAPATSSPATVSSSGACAASTVYVVSAGQNSSSVASSAGTTTTIGGTTSGGTEMIPSGIYYSDSTSGYPISSGGRAVGSGVPQTNTTTVYVDQGGNVVPAPPPQAVGRNGLLSNPPVDQPSSHGTAYSRSL
jgi:hypothetical protein